jgi:hypothetical protein
MGDIADMLLDGTLDFYTGEYLGRGYGVPRTKDRSLPWERHRGIKTNKIKDPKEAAYNGVKKYIAYTWNGSANIPSVRELLYEYTGEKNFDIKLRCISIQQEWRKFTQWISIRKKAIL